MADATVTVNPMVQDDVPADGKYWEVSLYSASWLTVGQIKAAESGMRHYLTKLHVRTATATTITVGEDVLGTDAVKTKFIGPVPVNAASGVVPFKARDGKGIKCSAGIEITLSTTDAAPLWVYAEGKTCKA